MLDGKKPALKIDCLERRHTGISPGIGLWLYEGACVCLSRHHESPVELEVCRSGVASAREVEFTMPDQTVLNAWANDIDATEAGAYGICIAAVETEENLLAVRRAETLTGADWYVGPPGTTADNLEACCRLEVSGLDKGSKSDVSRRLAQKVEQARRGASDLPAVATVIGFKERLLLIEKVSAEK